MSEFSHATQPYHQGETPGRFNLPLIIGLVTVLLATQACNAIPNKTGLSREAVKPGTVLFSEDFSKPPSGWGTWRRDGSSIEYREGGLRFQINETQFDFWSVAGKHFDDAQIEVDAIKLNGPDDNDFGLICRYQNKENFYMLVASSDGYYGIAKMKAGQYFMIGSEQLQYSESIRKGLAINHVRADCIGSKLRLSANGQKLVETTDTDFATGDVGLVAGAYNSPGVDILFDNFVVKQP